MSLNTKQQEAFDLLQEGENLFLFGPAGSGKSFFIKELYKRSRKTVCVTSTTGISAIAIGGKTIHSFSGIGFGDSSLDNILTRMRSYTFEKIANCEILVIDEISMLNSKLFNLIDNVFQNIKMSREPFGGITLCVVGDFLQLPPVVKNGQKDIKYAFNSKSWKDCNFTHINLDEIFRQKDKEFVDILNELRFANVSDKTEKLLQNLPYDKSKVPEGVNPVVLYTTNRKVNQYNLSKYKQLEGEERTFEIIKQPLSDPMIRKISQDKIDKYIASLHLDEELKLKIGTQVMHKVNNPDYGIANGSLGVVTSFRGENPVIKFTHLQQEITITRHEFDVSEDGKSYGKVVAMPLVYAYAITVHKSQGMSISYLYCNLNNILTDSQVYVAISRAETLEGLFIEGFKKENVTCCPEVIEFFKSMQSETN